MGPEYVEDQVSTVSLSFSAHDPGHWHRMLTPRNVSYLNRLALNYKRIPYKVEWVEYPDIRSTCERLGAPPSTYIGHEPFYTVPFIYDPKTQTYISDSTHIAQYLEATYPDTPKLFPEGPLNGAAALNLFQDIWQEKCRNPLSPLVIPKVYQQLNPASQPYFRETRERRFGKKLEDVIPSDDAARKEMWDLAKAGFGKMDGYMKWNGTASTFWMGEVRSYADLVMVALLLWVQTIYKQGSVEWTEMAAWHDGRWSRLLSAFEDCIYADGTEEHRPRMAEIASEQS